jgi:tetratricopeptide (TPR) repeat protein
LLAVFIAGVAALLAVPHSVPPVDVPEPMLDPIALDQVARSDAALAAAAERERLDTDVRELGSALRAYNLAERLEDLSALAFERRHVAEAAARAVVQGDGPLARLRAYQLRAFQRELHHWEETGEETEELRELGGSYLDGAYNSGWITGPRRPAPERPGATDRTSGAWVKGQHVLPDATVRAVIFKKRWSELGMVQGRALGITHAETIALYRFLLQHPPLEGKAPENKADELRRDHQAQQYRLKKIEDLRTFDPAYPADLGRGVVFYRLHSYGMAVESFRRHLEAHPEGPYALRAQGYLRAALDAAIEAP